MRFGEEPVSEGQVSAAFGDSYCMACNGDLAVLVEKNLSLLASDGYRRTPSTDDTFHVRDLTDVIWGRKWMILACAVVALVAAGVYLSVTDPRYVAKTFVAFDPLSKNLLIDVTSQPNGSTDNARIESELEIMQSDAVLLKAAELAGLSPDDGDDGKGFEARLANWLGIAASEPDKESVQAGFVDKLRRSASIRREGTSYVMSISVTSTTATEAATLANGIAQAYLARQISHKIALADAARERLENSAASLSEELADSKKNLDDMLADIVARAASPEIQRLVGRRKALADEAEYVQKRRADIAAALAARDYNALSSLIKARTYGMASERTPEVMASGALADALLSGKTGVVDAPLVRAVEDRLFVMDQSIATTNDEMRSIDGQLKLVANEVDLDPKLYVKRLQYAQQLQNTRDQYQAIMPRLANMKAQADLQVPDSRVISPATAPVDPSSPDFAVVFGGALAGGLALGAGLSLAQGDGRLRARSVRQLQNLPGVQGSLLVQLDRRQRIPIVKGLESTTGLSTTFENSLARLRTMIDRYECERAVSYGVKAGRVISVTSSVRDNQGVMLSAALSSGCQLGGEKVLLLVDDISGFIRDYPGALELSDARNGDPFTAVPGLPDLYVDPHSGLSVSSLRSLDGHAGGALGTTAMGIQLDERMALYKRVYGTIFVEAPPVQDLARLAELASRSDLILYCARAGRYPIDRIKADIASISDVANRDTPILAVLTRLA